MKVRIVMFGLIASVIAALIITSQRQQAQLRQSIAQTQRALQTATPVEVVNPFRRTLRETVRVMGTVKAQADITIASEITGRVIALSVDEGDVVKAGQVLIRLDDSVVRAQVEQARAAYQQALVRYRQALTGSAIPSTQADTDVEQAVAQLEQLQARLRQLQTNRELTYRETDLTVQQAEAAVEMARNRVRELERQLEIIDEQLRNQLQQAEAQKRAAELTLKKLREGARPQEKEQARQQLLAAEANLKNAKLRHERAQKLYADGAIAKADLDEADRALQTAQAAYDAAKAAYDLIVEGTRAEDIAVAEEQLRQAEANLRNAQAAQKQRDILRSQLESARAQLKQAEAQLELAKASQLRRQLVERDIEALQGQIKQLQATLKLAKAGQVRKVTTQQEVQAAKAAVEQARAALENAQAMLQKTVIVAPADGYIAAKMVEVGNTATPGTPLLRLVTAGTLEFEAPISESDFAKVRDGQIAFVQVNTLPDRLLRGIVRKVVSVAEASSRQFKVKVILPVTDRRLRPGSFARGEIVVREIPDALVVPRECVVEWQGKTSVFVAENNVARQRPVRIGMRTEKWLQILAGLTEKDAVIRTGLERISDGTPIRVVGTE
ncbi:Multidrug resistance protein MdtA [bacterium HR17]|uniref:Multidrug resistance protein MdtA n=1 Tax=Candidatus Fervidibacter japonicus TaxID=2035412 RepID=A0A2H5XFF5_9BACT|nr:Multidrug resistance protein MdtA [bacterium HR17]